MGAMDGMESGEHRLPVDSFEFFARLVKAFSTCTKTAPPIGIFRKWLLTLPAPLPPSFGSHLFNLLYPHISPRRRYGMQEAILSQRINQVMGWAPSSISARTLATWNSGEDLRAGVVGKRGFLGDEVQKVLEWRDGIKSGEGWKRMYTGQDAIALGEVNELLDQLAAHCPWSQIVPPIKPILTQDQVLTRLYTRSNLSPYALSLLTQIILRDIRPLLDPLNPSALNPITALKQHTSTECPQLDLMEAFRAWDIEMPGLWKVRGDLDLVCQEIEAMGGGAGQRVVARSNMSARLPTLHVNVTIPKAEKGRTLESAMQMAIRHRGRVMDRWEELWAETKYDGFRMQIHVEVMANRLPKITIFSKSKRNSTQDRLATHSIILASLGLPFAHLKSLPKLSERFFALPGCSTSPVRSVILEAEMVPYNEGEREGGRGPGIEEFWNLSRMKGGVAGAGERVDDLDEACFMSRSADRHHCISYFDILHLNGSSYVDKSYRDRRAALESVVKVIPGFSLCANRRKIALSNDFECCMKHLENAFSVECFENREEGLMLKHSDSVYNDPRLRWVKLKRDYIPGIGDCVDLVAIGAGWDRDRARDLKVGTGAFTTLYIAVWTNKRGFAANREKPHFEHLFCSSYGLDRAQLDLLNNQIRQGDYPSKSYATKPIYGCSAFRAVRETMAGLSYDFSLRKDSSPPMVIFQRPMTVELMGAGFQRLWGSRYHELRWPRMMKVFPPSEREWSEALSGEQYRAECAAALGHSDAQHHDMQQLVNQDELGLPLERDVMDEIWDTSSAGGLDIPDKLGLTPSPAKPVVKREILTDLTNRLSPIANLVDRISGPSKCTPLTLQRLTPQLGQARATSSSFTTSLVVWFAGNSGLPPAGQNTKPKHCVRGAMLSGSLKAFLRSAGWTDGKPRILRGRHVIFIDLAEISLAQVKRILEPFGRRAPGGRPIALVDVHYLYAKSDGGRERLERHTYETLRPALASA